MPCQTATVLRKDFIPVPSCGSPNEITLQIGQLGSYKRLKLKRSFHATLGEHVHQTFLFFYFEDVCSLPRIFITSKCIQGAMKCRHAREMCYMMAHVTPQQSFSSVSPVFEIKGAGVRGALDIAFWSCRAPDLKGRHIDKCSVPTNLANVFNTMHLKTFEMLVNDIGTRSSPLVPGLLWSLGCEKPAISRSSSLSLGRTNVF